MITTIRLPICNVFLLTGERPILVDTGRPRDAGRIEGALRASGVALKDLSLILHTHGHWDHAGSTAEFRRKTAAPAAIHRADAPLLRRGDNGLLRATGLAGWLLKPFINRHFPPFEPDLVFDGELDLAPYGVAAKAISTPGHTAGSISVFTRDSEAIIGDLIMGGFLGGRIFRRRPGFHYYAEDKEQVRQSVRGLLALKPSVIHAGHGGPLAPARVGRWLG